MQKAELSIMPMSEAFRRLGDRHLFLKLGHSEIELVIDGVQLLVNCLDLLLGGFQFFVGGLEFLVHGQDLFIGRRERFGRAFVFIDAAAKFIFQGFDLDFKLRDQGIVFRARLSGDRARKRPL
jgi:hypothetical protein